MPKVQLLGPPHYPIQKWKNGRGTTSQLAIFPGTADFPIDDYVWRISSARIDTDGPFSPFPGFRRVLIPVEGAPLEIILAPGTAAERRTELGPLSPLEFSGDLPATARLRGSAVIDYNVFWKASLVRGHVRVILNAGELAFDESDRVLFLTFLNAGTELVSRSLGLQSVFGPWDSLRIDLDPADVLPDLKVTFAGAGALVQTAFRDAGRSP